MIETPKCSQKSSHEQAKMLNPGFPPPISGPQTYSNFLRLEYNSLNGQQLDQASNVMPLTATYTEEMVQGLAPNEATFQKAQEIARSKRFQRLGISADGSWLLGECQGSGQAAYHISADFHDPNNPTLRSSSPSRKTPDKFSLALLLSYLQNPSEFATQEPSEDLLIKREKKIAFEEKKKSGSAAPRKVSKPSADKKVAAQREGFEHLERFLVDLVAVGQFYEPSQLEKIERQSKHLNDSYLPAATFGLRKLMLLAKQKELNDEEKMIQALEVVGQLWATVQKGRMYLDNRLPAGESQQEADAVIEDVIAKSWQLSELRDKGYFQTDLSLLELAFERIDDESRQQRLEVSDLLDTNSGAIYQAITYRPFKGLNQVPEQTSYMQPLSVAEVAVLPGFVNRRIRWEKGTEQLIENPPPDSLAKAYGMAMPDFKSAIDRLRTQLQHPLAPREAVFFLRCERIGRIGERAVIEDGSGLRIEMRDRRKDYSNVANLIRAAGMLAKEQPAILARLYLLPASNTVVGLPLAAVTTKHHLRLGL